MQIEVVFDKETKPAREVLTGEKRPARPSPQQLALNFSHLWLASPPTEVMDEIEKADWLERQSGRFAEVLRYSHLMETSIRFVLALQKDSLKRGLAPNTRAPLGILLNIDSLTNLFIRGRSVQGIEIMLNVFRGSEAVIEKMRGVTLEGAPSLEEMEKAYDSKYGYMGRQKL